MLISLKNCVPITDQGVFDVVNLSYDNPAFYLREIRVRKMSWLETRQKGENNSTKNYLVAGLICDNSGK